MKSHNIIEIFLWSLLSCFFKKIKKKRETVNGLHIKGARSVSGPVQEYNSIFNILVSFRACSLFFKIVAQLTDFILKNIRAELLPLIYHLLYLVILNFRTGDVH